jgi:hypothetical protein
MTSVERRLVAETRTVRSCLLLSMLLVAAGAAAVLLQAGSCPAPPQVTQGPCHPPVPATIASASRGPHDPGS